MIFNSNRFTLLIKRGAERLRKYFYLTLEPEPDNAGVGSVQTPTKRFKVPLIERNKYEITNLNNCIHVTIITGIKRAIKYSNL